MKLTISEAARLYGMHRATLHRHLKNGRITRDSFPDGSPALEFSELRRAYGEPTNAPEVRQPATPPVASNATPQSDTLLLEEIRKQTAVIERMSERIERLEAALLRLPPPSDPEPPKQRPQATPEPRPTPSKPTGTISLSDIAARLAERTGRQS
jgi:hypothetical protein